MAVSWKKKTERREVGERTVYKLSMYRERMTCGNRKKNEFIYVWMLMICMCSKPQKHQLITLESIYYVRNINADQTKNEKNIFGHSRMRTSGSSCFFHFGPSQYWMESFCGNLFNSFSHPPYATFTYSNTIHNHIQYEPVGNNNGTENEVFRKRKC